MSGSHHVRVYVHDDRLSFVYRELDQQWHRDMAIPVHTARDMVDRIRRRLGPHDLIDYLYIDGHGSPYGMDLGLEEGSPLRIHTVAPGETLGSIADHYYGASGRWRDVYERNRSRTGPNPDRIHPGDKLVIAHLPALADSEYLRTLRPKFAAGATVFLGGCKVGQNRELLATLSTLWGVHVRAGVPNQRSLWPGAEGPVLHCFIRKCEMEPGTFWGIREGD